MVGSGDTGVISRGVSGVFGFIKKKVEKLLLLLVVMKFVVK